MRAHPEEFSCARIDSVSALLQKLKEQPGKWKPLAGGTDIMVSFAAGKLAHKDYLDISGLKELQQIKVTENFIELGAGVTYTEIASHPMIALEFPNLKTAALETGAVAIQNRGTVGGNIANASPAADSPPALLAYAAELVLSSLDGSRQIPYAGFHTGYKTMILAPEEIITAVRLPRKPARNFHFYWKVGTRKAQAISKVCVAASARFSGHQISDIKIACGGVAPVPLLAAHCENYLQGMDLSKIQRDELKKRVTLDISAIDDIRSNKNYRTTVTQNLVIHLLEKMRHHVGLDS